MISKSIYIPFIYFKFNNPFYEICVYSNILPRSATFHQAVDESGMTVGGHLQRSETMPHSVAQQGEQEREKERLEISSLWSQNKDSVTSSLSSLGSSLKLSFG